MFLYSSIFTNFGNETRLLTIVNTFAFTLVPAIVLELCKNPVCKSSSFPLFVFMRHMKVVSRVLLCLWAILAVAGAGNRPLFYLYTFPLFGLLLLLPAGIVEKVCNPVWNGRPGQECSRAEEDEGGSALKHPVDKPRKYVPPSRIVARIFLGFTLFTLIVGSCTVLSSDAPDKQYIVTNIAPSVLFCCITVVLYLVSLTAPKTRQEALLRKKQCRRINAATVFGVILSILGGCLSAHQIIMILESSLMADPQNLPDSIRIGYAVGVFGPILLLSGICLLKKNAARRATEQMITCDDYEIDMETHQAVEPYGYYDVETEATPTYSIVDSIDGMEGHDFEYFCAQLLQYIGFEQVTVTPGSGDQGVDIIAMREGVRYAIQCKNYSTPLGNKPIQEVHAGKTFYGCHVGVVLTNSTFTTGAIALANATGVLLWDRSVLQNMMTTART